MASTRASSRANDDDDRDKEDELDKERESGLTVDELIREELAKKIKRRRGQRDSASYTESEDGSLTPPPPNTPPPSTSADAAASADVPPPAAGRQLRSGRVAAPRAPITYGRRSKKPKTSSATTPKKAKSGELRQSSVDQDRSTPLLAVDHSKRSLAALIRQREATLETPNTPKKAHKQLPNSELISICQSSPGSFTARHGRDRCLQCRSSRIEVCYQSLTGQSRRCVTCRRECSLNSMATDSSVIKHLERAFVRAGTAITLLEDPKVIKLLEGVQADLQAGAEEKWGLVLGGDDA